MGGREQKEKERVRKGRKEEGRVQKAKTNGGREERYTPEDRSEGGRGQGCCHLTLSLQQSPEVESDHPPLVVLPHPLHPHHEAGQAGGPRVHEETSAQGEGLSGVQQLLHKALPTVVGEPGMKEGRVGEREGEREGEGRRRGEEVRGLMVSHQLIQSPSPPPLPLPHPSLPPHQMYSTCSTSGATAMMLP